MLGKPSFTKTMKYSFSLGLELFKQGLSGEFTGKNSDYKYLFEKARKNRMVSVIVQQNARKLSGSDATSLKNEYLWLKRQNPRDFVGKKTI